MNTAQLGILGLALIGCCGLAMVCLWLACEVSKLRATVAKHGQAIAGLVEINDTLLQMAKDNHKFTKEAHERIDGVHGAVRAAARADIGKGSAGFVR